MEKVEGGLNANFEDSEKKKDFKNKDFIEKIEVDRIIDYVVEEDEEWFKVVEDEKESDEKFRWIRFLNFYDKKMVEKFRKKNNIKKYRKTRNK